MSYSQWIADQINGGKSWDDLLNVSQEEFFSLREYQGIIPRSIKTLSDWQRAILERKAAYGAAVEATGISINDPLNLEIPRGVSSCWKAYRESLGHTMSSTAVENLERSAHWVLNQLARDSGIRKGLVMGSVQSGKTANMVGLTSMAADYDWNFFIILSGSIDNLRIQTRERFKRDLINTDSVQWHVLDYGCDSDHLYDYYSGRQVCLSDLKLNALGNHGHVDKYVMVCLKQSSRLGRLIKWLHSSDSIASKLRLIVIDDEADQASINTRLMEDAVDEEPEDDVERTRINQSIVSLVSNCTPEGEPSSAPLQSINYLSYTATPYANILNEKIDGYSLYPSDFIYSLPEPQAYFGAKVIFGSHSNPENYPGLNIIRPIFSGELSRLNNTKVPLISIPESLERALKWFFCAAAVMRQSDKKRPISMLIHTSPRVRIHLEQYLLVSKWLKSLDKDGFVSACKEIYEEETTHFTKADLLANFHDYDAASSVPDTLPAFEDIADDIKRLLSTITHIALDDNDDLEYTENGIHLCVDNCAAQRYAESDEYMRIVYPDSAALDKLNASPVFIVFGGNTLSRGLTLEGLVCTYFARNVTQADTLMQMARWFGYRKGYELLQRIWLSDESKKHFELLERIDEELKAEINNFVKEKRTPKEFGPKVLNSKSISRLRITAKNKMQAAVETGASFVGEAFETTKFRASDLTHNIEALDALIKEIGQAPVYSEHSKASLLWRGVATDIVLRFLSSYRLYDSENEKFARILQMITTANSELRYLDWNVVIVDGDSKTTNGSWNPYQGFSVRKSKRSKLTNEPDIDIHRLRYSKDALCDVPVSSLGQAQKAIYEEADRTGSAITLCKGKLGMTDTPLLLIYRLDKDAPREGAKKNGLDRTDLATDHDVIAYAIILAGDGKENAGPSALSIT